MGSKIACTTIFDCVIEQAHTVCRQETFRVVFAWNAWAKNLKPVLFVAAIFAQYSHISASLMFLDRIRSSAFFKTTLFLAEAALHQQYTRSYILQQIKRWSIAIQLELVWLLTLLRFECFKPTSQQHFNNEWTESIATQRWLSYGLQGDLAQGSNSVRQYHHQQRKIDSCFWCDRILRRSSN